MNREEIQTAVLEIIQVVAPDEDVSHLKPELKLREQLALDSMDFLDIVMELRKRYGVHVPEADYRELATLEGCVNYLAPKLEGKSAKLVAR